MEQTRRMLSFLGLAQKAGKVAGGEFMTENAVKSGHAYLVLVAGDASDNTKKKFRNMCEYYKVPMMVCSAREELGRAIGRQMRASLAVTDEKFAEGLKRYQKVETTVITDGGSENGE